MPPKFTDEDRKRALNAAGLTPEQQAGVIAGRGYTPTVVNGRELKAPQTDFQTTKNTSIQDISGLDVELPEITPESSAGQANTLLSEVKKIREQTLGKSAFQIEQENAQNIPEIIKTQGDLASQLKQIQNEADQLKVEAQTIPSILQQQSVGRGITAGGLAPLQAGALRENQIKAATVASRGLVISSLFEATKGQLATAQYLADRAVKQKYAPLEEELATRLDNLELILQSPQYDEETKNRASKRKIIEEANATQLARAKENEKSAQTLKIDIFSNNQNISPKMAQVLQEQTDPVRLAQIATEAGLNLKKQDNLYETRETVGGEIIEVQKNSKGQVISTRVVREGKKDGVTPSTGFADSKIESSVREDASALLSELPNPTEADLLTAFKRLRTLYSPQEATDGAIQSLLGLTPSGIDETDAELPGEIMSAEELGQATVKGAGKAYLGVGEGIRRFTTGIGDFGAGVIEGLISPFRKKK